MTLTVACRTRLGFSWPVDRHAWRGRAAGVETTSTLVYRLYERRARGVPCRPRPSRVASGVMCDGNRRVGPVGGGSATSASGHREGAGQVFELLEWCRESGVEVVSPVAAVHRQPDPARRPSCPAAEDHRGHRAGPWWQNAGASNPVGALDLLPGDAVRVLKARPKRPPPRPGCCVNVGGRVRRAAGDRGSPCAPATGPRDAGDHDRGTGRSARRRAHRRAPVHQGPARPGPGASGPRASSAWTASCSGKVAARSSTSATPMAAPSARWTSCGRCAPTRPGTVRFGT